MLEINNSLLVVIDVQGKLAAMMHNNHYLRPLQGAIKAAKILDIPVIITEQAPDKIGFTIDDVRSLLPEVLPIVKQSFSCCGEPVFMNMLKKSGRRQIIVAGIESHVCVYQTVRDLLKAKYQVYLMVDAVSARSVTDHEIGIRRSEKEGAVLVTFEMTVTELLTSTKHSKFRDIMSLLKNSQEPK